MIFWCFCCGWLGWFWYWGMLVWHVSAHKAVASSSTRSPLVVQSEVVRTCHQMASGTQWVAFWKLVNCEIGRTCDVCRGLHLNSLLYWARALIIYKVIYISSTYISFITAQPNLCTTNFAHYCSLVSYGHVPCITLRNYTKNLNFCPAKKQKIKKVWQTETRKENNITGFRKTG